MTFEAYEARLKIVASSIRGGLAANNDIALATFIKRELPDKADFVMAQIDTDSETVEESSAYSVAVCTWRRSHDEPAARH